MKTAIWKTCNAHNTEEKSEISCRWQVANNMEILVYNVKSKRKTRETMETRSWGRYRH